MELNAQQREAVNSDHPLILAVATPGSGKTSVLVARITRLVETAYGVDPARFVAITFTNAAAGELKERLKVKLGFVGTCHSFAMMLLRRHGTLLGYRSENIVVQDEDGSAEVMGSVIADLKQPGSAKTFFKKWNRSGAALKGDDLITGREYLFRLRRNNTVDYDRILSECVELLGLTEVVDALLTRYSHIFYDEFQDCAPDEAAILSRLRGLRQFVVGDPDQCVYQFRGASIENILTFASQPQVQALSLPLNYRSTENICAAANRLIRHNKKRLNVEIEATREEGVDVAARQFDWFVAEAEFVVKWARELLHDCPPEEVAVLCRTNELATYLRERLKAANLVVSASSASQESAWPTAAKWSPFLQVLADPWNDLIGRRYLKSIGADTADVIGLANTAEIPLLSAHAKRLGKDPLPFNVKVQDIPAIIAQRASGTPYDCGMIQGLVERFMREETDTSTVSSFVAWMHQTMRYEAASTGPGVFVSTVHGAKGMEFRHVLMAGCEKEWWEKAGDDMEAERRLFYVGMTRAKDTLVMTWAARRDLKWKRGAERTASRFIEEAA